MPPGRKLRTCIGAPSWRGRPISLKRAIGTCGTSTPTSTTPSSPEAATNQSQFTNGHRPQLKARQGRPHQLSHSNSQAPHQVHPPPQLCPPSRLQLQAQRRHRQQQGREIRLQLQAQRFHQEPQLRARPDLHPIHLQLRVGEGTLLRGGPHRGGRGHRRQGDNLPLHRRGRRQPDAQDPELPSGLQLQAAGSRTRSSSSSTPPARASLSSRPLILAPANCAYPTTRVDSTGIWILQHRYEGAARPTRRATHPVPSDDPYDLPDSYWHHPPRTESSSDPPRGHGRAEHYNLSESPPPERSAQAVYSGRAAFNPDRVHEAEQVSIKRPAPAGRDSSTAPATKTARIVFAKRESQVKAPPQSVLDQAAADRAASKAIPPPPLRAPPAPPAPVPRAAAQRSVGSKIDAA